MEYPARPDDVQQAGIEEQEQGALQRRFQVTNNQCPSRSRFRVEQNPLDEDENPGRGPFAGKDPEKKVRTSLSSVQEVAMAWSDT